MAFTYKLDYTKPEQTTYTQCKAKKFNFFQTFSFFYRNYFTIVFRHDQNI